MENKQFSYGDGDGVVDYPCDIVERSNSKDGSRYIPFNPIFMGYRQGSSGSVGAPKEPINMLKGIKVVSQPPLGRWSHKGVVAIKPKAMIMKANSASKMVM